MPLHHDASLAGTSSAAVSAIQAELGHPVASVGARERLEAASVDILTRRNRELEEEVEKLRVECERAGHSFKLAWMEERKQHLQDSEASAATNALAKKEAAEQVAAAKAAQAKAESAAAASERQLADQRDELERARRGVDEARYEARTQVHSLQKQLARARAEKGALCEEFSQRLQSLGALEASGYMGGASAGAGGAGSAGGAGGAELSLARCLGGTSSSDDAHAGGDGGGGALSGYEALSAFSDGSAPQLALAIQQASTPTRGGQQQQQQGRAQALEVRSIGSPGASATSAASPPSMGKPMARGIGFSGLSSFGPSAGASAGGSGAHLSQHEAAAEEEARQAIDAMKLSQQLRNAESELEKLQRLYATKSRRVAQLQNESEETRSRLQARDAEVEGWSGERAKLVEDLEMQRTRAERLEDEVERLKRALSGRVRQLEKMEQDQLALAAQLDSLHLVGGGGARAGGGGSGDGGGDGGGEDSWRPPRHPSSLLRRALTEHEERVEAAEARAARVARATGAAHSPARRGSGGGAGGKEGRRRRKVKGGGPICGGWVDPVTGVATAAVPVAVSGGARGDASARSEASTISDTEWPDELGLGPVP